MRQEHITPKKRAPADAHGTASPGTDGRGTIGIDAYTQPIAVSLTALVDLVRPTSPRVRGRPREYPAARPTGFPRIDARSC